LIYLFFVRVFFIFYYFGWGFFMIFWWCLYGTLWYGLRLSQVIGFGSFVLAFYLLRVCIFNLFLVLLFEMGFIPVLFSSMLLCDEVLCWCFMLRGSILLIGLLLILTASGFVFFFFFFTLRVLKIWFYGCTFYGFKAGKLIWLSMSIIF